MITLIIDGQEVKVEPGTVIIDAARLAGINVPSMCYVKELDPSTSCMVCVVKVEGFRKLLPSCSAKAEDGMVVDTMSDEVLDARRTALELLLSDHTGDCEGPCRVTCPASMRIPDMLRAVGADQWDEALAIVRDDLVFPETLGYICPGPCQKACRRAGHDGAVEIRALHRHVAARAREEDSGKEVPESGKRVAVIGAGPAGLAGAAELTSLGHRCVIFDDRELAGGMMRYGVKEDILPRDVLGAETGRLVGTGITLNQGTKIEGREGLAHMIEEYDAVLVAVGGKDAAEPFGLDMSDRGIAVDRQTFATSVTGVFAAGGAITPIKKMAVRAVGSGRRAARAIHAFLIGDVTLERRAINVSMGRVSEEEMALFLEMSSPKAGVLTKCAGEETDTACREEAIRCLRCDCRKADSCVLRGLSTGCGALVSRFRADRRLFLRDISHDDIVYESGKCISCGLCIQTAGRAGERIGTTFLGRGFAVRVGVPLGGQMKDALETTGAACVEVCPTGALAFKDGQP